MGTMIDEFRIAEDEGFKTADCELWKRMLDAIKAPAIPDNPEENEDLCNVYRTGARFAYCHPRVRKGETEYGPMAWAACVSLKSGQKTRTIYRGTLYQCVLAIDCYNIAREPYLRKSFDRCPAGRHTIFRFDEENVVKPALAYPPMADYMKFIIDRFKAQGFLREKTTKQVQRAKAFATLPLPTWERWTKLFSQNEEHAKRLDLLSGQLDSIARQLDLWHAMNQPANREPSNEKLLEDLAQAKVVDHGGIVEVTMTPTPENTKEPSPVTTSVADIGEGVL